MTEENMKDHDLLITINAKLSGLCRDLKTVKDENKKAHEKIWDGIEKRIDKTLPSKVFYWIMPFVIFGLMGIAGLASSNRYEMGKNKTAIEVLHKEDLKEKEIGEKTKDAVTESIIIQESK